MAKVYFYNESSDGKKLVKDVSKAETGLSVSYTDGTEKEIEIEATGGSGSVGVPKMSQVTKLEVTAGKDVLIPIKKEEDFAFFPAEVLKLYSESGSVAGTVCEFNNGDQKDFTENDFVEFDGTMKLKTTKVIPGVKIGTLGDGFITKFLIDQMKFGTILKMEVSD